MILFKINNKLALYQIPINWRRAPKSKKYIGNQFWCAPRIKIKPKAAIESEIIVCLPFHFFTSKPIISKEKTIGKYETQLVCEMVEDASVPHMATALV